MARSRSSAIAHLPSISNSRRCISAAAALVKVRHRILEGSASSKSRRATRSVSTRVFPEPAFADTQTEQAGRAALRWARTAS